MDTRKLKIETWDAGWYQIRRCLAEHGFNASELDAVRVANAELACKIEPQIEEYGFLDRDEIFEDV